MPVPGFLLISVMVERGVQGPSGDASVGATPGFERGHPVGSWGRTGKRGPSWGEAAEDGRRGEDRERKCEG